MGLHIKAGLRSFLEGQLNRQYRRRLAGAKRRISYEEWLRLQEKRGDGKAKASRYWSGTPAGQCAASQQQGFALLKEQGIWLILQEDGYVDPKAFSWIAGHFREHPETQLLYGDEDILDVTGEHRCCPCFKPDWSPDTWLSSFYLGSVIALRRELAQRLPAAADSPEMWPRDCEGVLRFARPAQARTLVHQLLDLAGGFAQGCDSVAHLRGMLFHMGHDAASAGVQREYRREDGFGGLTQTPWEAAHILAKAPHETISGWGGQPVTISVIIPSKDNPQVLKQCLESLRRCQGKRYHLEILVVDNGSSPENKAEIEKIAHGTKYIYEPMSFNFSKMCNRGAQEAEGELLLFLNDDITVNADGWLEAMAERAMRPYVGAVGLKLYYPQSTTIQHAGITNLPGGPVHKLQFTQDGEDDDYGYGSLDRNVIGVTGACLMVKRERFRQAGGFPEDLQVAYNDVELCFRLREAGWHNVVLNSYHAYHHESLSRGSDLTREKMLRLRQERQTLYGRHRQYLNYDPYYQEPLCMELGDMHVGEVYLDTEAEPQMVSRCRRLPECLEREPENLAYAVQVEEGQQGRKGASLALQGYIAVKWENNACYERYLLLQRQGTSTDTYVIHLQGKYSREAEYGLQEQPNVALAGFLVVLKQGLLADGCYRVGVQARSRIGRRRLTAWTEQTVKVEDGISES